MERRKRHNLSVGIPACRRLQYARRPTLRVFLPASPSSDCRLLPTFLPRRHPQTSSVLCSGTLLRPLMQSLPLSCLHWHLLHPTRRAALSLRLLRPAAPHGGLFLLRPMTVRRRLPSSAGRGHPARSPSVPMLHLSRGGYAGRPLHRRSAKIMPAGERSRCLLIVVGHNGPNQMILLRA